MLTEEKKNKLYEMVIRSKNLTIGKIVECGFAIEEIDLLIKTKIILKLDKGIYKFIDDNALNNFGDEYLKENNYEKAAICFETCYNLLNNSKKYYLKTILAYIYAKDYKSILDIINNKINSKISSDNIEMINISNIIIYLITFLTIVPDNIKNYSLNLEKKDYIIDNQKSYSNDINIIKKNILSTEFRRALNKIRAIHLNNNFMSIEELIIKHLLLDVITVCNNRKKEAVTHIKNKDYNMLISLLEKPEETNNITQKEIYVLKLAKALTDPLMVDIISSTNKSKNTKIFKAINFKNYKNALDISQNHINKFDKPIEDNMIHLLLLEINSIRDEYYSESSINEVVTIEELLSKFKDAEYTDFLKLLKNYLSKINKLEYSYLVLKICRITIMSKSNNFDNLKKLLIDLASKEFKINVTNYTKEFYQNLNDENFGIAKLYYYIILDAYNKNHTHQNLTFLKNVYNNARTIYSEKRVVKSEYNAIEEEIKSKFDLLEKNGIIMLKSESEEHTRKLINYVSTISDLKFFTIENENDEYIVIRKRIYYNHYRDFNTIIKAGSEEYHAGNYNVFIEEYKKLLLMGNPKSYVYAKLGLAYYKTLNLEVALQYLMIANSLSKKEKGNHDYSDLINEIKEKLKISTDADSYMVDRLYYEEQKINLENLFAQHASGISFYEICEDLNLNNEEKNIAALLLAKQKYVEADYSSGDKFLKLIEQSSDKSEHVIQLLEYVRQRKKFYKNQI